LRTASGIGLLKVGLVSGGRVRDLVGGVQGDSLPTFSTVLCAVTGPLRCEVGSGAKWLTV